MPDIYQNFVGGELDVDLLTAGTSMSSPALAALSVVASPNTMRIVIDPDGIMGEPEVVLVTVHTASAVTATVTRAQEGTTARDHLSGMEWVHTVTKEFFGYWLRGSGTPEGVVTAPVGSSYLRSDGGTSTTLYVKESGTGNTGWVAK